MTGESPLISVVIPIYGVAPYLRRCIDSVLHQSYRNIEVVLVDDGSPDASGAICDAYREQDSRVVVIHKSNGGISDARNRGTEVATGTYLTYLDGDDWIHRDCLATLYRLVSTTGADISACGHLSTEGGTGDTPLAGLDYTVYAGGEIRALIWANVDQADPLHRDMIVAWGKLYRRDLIRDIRYPVGKLHEDNFVTHRLLNAARKVAYTPARLVYYFQRSGSVTSGGFNLPRRLCMIESYEARAQFFAREGLDDIAAFCDKMQFQKVFSTDPLLEGNASEGEASGYGAMRRRLRYRLRRGRHGVAFRLFAESYFLLPGVVRWLHQLRGKPQSRTSGQRFPM